MNESAKLDDAPEFLIYRRIILPLSTQIKALGIDRAIALRQAALDRFLTR